MFSVLLKTSCVCVCDMSGYREVCGGGHRGGALSDGPLSTTAARHRGSAHERDENSWRSVRSGQDVFTSGTHRPTAIPLSHERFDRAAGDDVICVCVLR